MSQSQLHGFTLGVAVASHRDEAHLARTLEAADQALHEAGIAPVARVLVAAEHSATAEKRAQERGWTYRRVLPDRRARARRRARRRDAARAARRRW